METMKNKIEQYIKEHTYAWSPTTQKSEYARLISIRECIGDTSEVVWNKIQHLKPYTRKTTFIRLCHFYSWLYPKQENIYRIWYNKNKRLFKYVYMRSSPQITFKDAIERLCKLTDQETKEKALQLLRGGLRFKESFTVQDNKVIGKGNKMRSTHVNPLPNLSFSYQTFIRRLKKVGLKPHDLRKICAKELVNKGVDVFSLCDFFGWSNLNTAQSYVNNQSIKNIGELLN